ncbi:hypothetical protein NFI96_030013 [Prochilodus magdalenae]|nr:hypothetical protein NFI96_030013 [Prochilodus magdalenae]
MRRDTYTTAAQQEQQEQQEETPAHRRGFVLHHTMENVWSVSGQRACRDRERVGTESVSGQKACRDRERVGTESVSGQRACRDRERWDRERVGTESVGTESVSGQRACRDRERVGTESVSGQRACRDTERVGTQSVSGQRTCRDRELVGTESALGQRACRDRERWDRENVGTERTLGQRERWDRENVGTERTLGQRACRDREGWDREGWDREVMVTGLVFSSTQALVRRSAQLVASSPVKVLTGVDLVRGQIQEGPGYVLRATWQEDRMLYRHGDRSPVEAYPTDPNQESAWPQGFGQLTQDGMRQHFKLGQFLRKRYMGFLSESYSRYEIAVRSTDHDRTLMSAESNLAGLYPPNGSQVFHPGLNWQPIPVHTVPKDEDRLLFFPLKNCPRYELLKKETEKTEHFLNMTQTYGDFLEMVRNKTGVDSTLWSIWKIYDALYCEEIHNKTRPGWVTPDVKNKLRILNDFSYQILFGGDQRKNKSRLQGGLLLDQIIKNFSAAANTSGQLKMIMYSAHDTTIVALQEALGVFNNVQPPYASCHILELHNDNGSVSVEMFYRNDSSVEKPYPITLPGCAQRCPLEDFKRLTRSVIPVDWHEECQIYAPYTGPPPYVLPPSVVETYLLLGYTAREIAKLFGESKRTINQTMALSRRRTQNSEVAPLSPPGWIKHSCCKV